MKSFLEWFKGSTKVKRWMLLIVLGIILTCYGFTKVLVNNEMDFAELIRIIGLFVIGFVFVVAPVFELGLDLADHTAGAAAPVSYGFRVLNERDQRNVHGEDHHERQD